MKWHRMYIVRVEQMLGWILGLLIMDETDGVCVV